MARTRSARRWWAGTGDDTPGGALGVSRGGAAPRHRGGVFPSACWLALRAEPSCGCSRHVPAEALLPLVHAADQPPRSAPLPAIDGPCGRLREIAMRSLMWIAASLLL